MKNIVHGSDAVDGAPLSRTTEQSRITGARRRSPDGQDMGADSGVRSLDWGSIVGSAAIGLTTTVMLIILGAGAGLIAGNEGTDAGEAAGILGAVGIWAVVAMVIGAFVGGVAGGRVSRWLDRGSIGYHALATWGLATLAGLLLASLIAIGFGSGAAGAGGAVVADESTQGEARTPATNTRGTSRGRTGSTAGDSQGANGAQGSTDAGEAADNAADGLGSAGLGLGAGMLLGLIALAGGWYLGSRKPLTSLERGRGRRDRVEHEHTTYVENV